MKVYLNKGLQNTGATDFIIRTDNIDIPNVLYCSVQHDDSGYYTATLYDEDGGISKGKTTYTAYEIDDLTTLVPRSCMDMSDELYQNGFRDFNISTSVDSAATYVTLPLEIDTEKNQGVFLYVHISDDSSYDIVAMGPVIISQTLEAWLENFDRQNREQTLKRLNEQFKCRLKPREAKKVRIASILNRQETTELVKEYDNCLVFGNEERALELREVLAANLEILELKVVGNSIIGTRTVTRALDLGTEQGQIAFSDLSGLEVTWPYKIDLSDYVLEADLLVNYATIVIEGLDQCIENTEKQFGITRYMAWRQVALSLLNRAAKYIYYLDTEDLLSIINNSNGEFIDVFQGSSTNKLVVTKDDFDWDGGDILFKILNRTTNYTEAGLYEHLLFTGDRKLGYTDDEVEDPDFLIDLLVSTPATKEQLLERPSYAIELEIYREGGYLPIHLNCISRLYPRNNDSILLNMEELDLGLGQVEWGQNLVEFSEILNDTADKLEDLAYKNRTRYSE